MDKAKSAISDFMHKSGKHDTTVHENVAPAVQHETVKPHHHEEINTAVDKEVHQDHYHRSVQPVQDREVLPEQHHTRLGEVQHREFDHRDHDYTKRSLAAEQGQFRDQRSVEDTTHTQAASPTIGGEHKHHHIHETIQPVIQRETVQPHVTHTTAPIHETHHNAAKHHEASSLPPMSMNDFKAKGGILGGRGEKYDAFEGEPKHLGGALSGVGHDGSHKHDPAHVHHHDGVVGGGKNYEGTDPGARRGIEHVGAGRDQGAGASQGYDDNGTGRNYDGAGTTGTQHTATKPSLMDKINPKKDVNGDGQAGFMK